MADSIDSLQIQISAQSTKANTSMDLLVKKIDRLSASLSTLDGHGLRSLASGVQSLGAAMQTMSNVKTTEFTRIAKIGQSLSGLSGVSQGAQQIVELANGIKQLGYKSADKAIANIPQLAVAMKQLMKELSRAPKVSQNLIDMTNALAKLARTGASSGKAATSLSTALTSVGKSSKFSLHGIQSINTSLKSINTSLKSMLRSILPVISAMQLFSVGGKTVEIASDLAEVENVVVNTFGQYSNQLDSFAKKAIQSFGISELTAKETASRFQAMGVAMGAPIKSMSEMSVSLTELSADLASFYNVGQAEAAKSLWSVFTGETEPMRKYGIDLTNATLKEWALKQGMDADIASMSQLEKTMLRYQYVMKNTENVQGDFARTSNNWANQLRILKEQLVALGGVMGNAFINMLKPLVSALNKAMTAVTTFVTNVVNALGVIFGWTIDVQSGYIADDFDGASDSADDLAKGTGKAADNAKKLRQQLQGVDELNVLTSPNDSTESGRGGSSSVNGTEGADTNSLKYQIKETEGLYKSGIKNLEQLGQYIGSSLTKAMGSINWSEIYSGASRFGSGLASFLNGLISPKLFGTTGKTIASALNTAIYAALSFGETFDWEDFGLSIATGINEFFATFDFASLAETINVWVQGIWTTIKTTIENIKWEDVWEGIKTFLENIDIETVGIIIGAVVIKKILGLHLASTVLDIIGTSISRSIAQSIAKTLGVEIAANAGIKTALEAGLTQAFKGISGMGILDIGTVLGAGTLTEKIAFIGKMLAGIGTVIGGAILAVKNFFSMWENGFSWLNEALMVLGIALAAVGAVILGAPALVTGAVAGVVAVVGTVAVVVKQNWETIKGWFSGLASWLKQKIASPVQKTFETLTGKIKGFFTALWTNITSVWATVATWFSEKVIEPVVVFFQGLWTRVKSIFDGLWIIIKAVWIVVSSWFSEKVITPVVNLFNVLKTKVSEFFKGLWTGIKSIWNSVSSWFNQKVVTPIINFFKPIVEKVKGFFSTLWSGIKSIWNSVSSWFNKTVIAPVSNAFKTACDKIKGFFSTLWSGIKQGVVGAMNAVIGGVEKGINFIVNGINAIIKGFNKVVSWAAKVAEVDWGGVDLVANVSLGRISGYELGGFPEQYSLFMAGEHGTAELLGTVGGKTAVAGGAEITGISDTIRATSSEEVALLRQQNALLQALLEKEVGISKNEIGKAAQSWARDYSRRTGREAYSF